MGPSFFCTICTDSSKHELLALLYTIDKYHSGATVHVLCDEPTYFFCVGVTGKNVIWHPTLPAKGIGRYQRDEEATQFFMKKADVIDIALCDYSDTMYIDADQVLTEVIDVDESKQLGVAPSYLKSTVSDRVGYYSGGLMWVSNKSITSDWRELAKTSKYVDQGAIEELTKKYSYFAFDEGHNFRCWRFKYGPESAREMRKKLSINGYSIYYGIYKVRTIHTHFDDPKFFRFNSKMISLMLDSGRGDIVDKIFEIPSKVSKAACLAGHVI